MEALGRLGAADLARVMVVYRDALEAQKDALNRLNVFPVPDGDTGTNMALTLDSVVSELGQIGGLEDVLSDNPEASNGSSRPTGDAQLAQARMEDVSKAISRGSLMGARGNSGVILSQLLRGLTGALASGGDSDGAGVAEALSAASDAAYKAVLRPVEGTILTVARAAAEGARASNGNGVGPQEDGGGDLKSVLERARAAAADALSHTPDLLPALSQAGVVDAGGGGYVLLLDSMLSVVDGRKLPEAPFPVPPGVAVGADGHGPQQLQVSDEELPDRGAPGAERVAELLRGGLRYEVMYLLEAPDDTIGAFKEVWEGIGDSIVVVGGEGIWNCHIHTNDVGAAIEAALDAGRPRQIRVSDLAEQIDEERWVREATASASQTLQKPAGHVARTAVIAVANGDGVGRIFRSLGVHHLVPGGQSMNPSTAQILEMVDAVDSDEIVILPNNENIVPVAMQACEVTDKTARVVPTSGIVEGFAALLEYDPEAGAEENVTSMTSSARRVVAGEVTQAVRDSTANVGPIKAGDWMGMSRDGVEVVADSMSGAACGLLDKLMQGPHELVTLIEGEGAHPGETRNITEWLCEHHPEVEFEVHQGGQPLYPYLISIE